MTDEVEKPAEVPRPRARVKIRVEFDKENGFEADARISASDAEEITRVFWAAVEKGKDGGR